MKYLPFREPNIADFDFAKWTARAERETAWLVSKVAAGHSISFKPRLWAELKRHLGELFEGFCAYCECRVKPATNGEVDHYRPKGKPREAADHPGYYWLAYTPSNLLFCCTACNGVKVKGAHFPVAGKHASCPSEVVEERPLLLNPYLEDDDPRKHLKFLPPDDAMPKISYVEALTTRGRASIEIFKLNTRHDLLEYRCARQQQFISDYRLTLLTADRETRAKLINDARAGRVQYSAACLSALEAWVSKLVAETLEQIHAPEPPEA